MPLRAVREKEPSARQETPGIQEVHSQLHALQHSTESSKIRVAPLLSQTAVTASTFFSPRPMTYPAVLLRWECWYAVVQKLKALKSFLRSCTL